MQKYKGLPDDAPYNLGTGRTHCSGSCHVATGIDVDGLPSQILGLHDHPDRRPNLVGSPQAAEWEMIRRLALRVLDHVGGDERRRDRIRGDPIRPQIRGVVVHQAFEAGLRCRIRGRNHAACARRAGRHENQTAAAFLQVRYGSLRDEKCGEQIGSQRPVEGQTIQLFKGNLLCNARVIDNAVEPAELIDSGGDEPSGLLAIANIGLDRQCLPPGIDDCPDKPRPLPPAL
jgi:hypothetical protein